MSRNDLPQKLQSKLDRDYAAFLSRLSMLTLQEQLSRSEEIAICEKLYRLLSGGGNWKAEELLYLSRFPYPLETLCRWFQYERRDWREMICHILWNIYVKRGRENPAPEEEQEEQ